MSKPDYAGAGRAVEASSGLTAEKMKRIEALIAETKRIELQMIRTERDLLDLARARAKIVGGIIKGSGVIEGELVAIFKEAKTARVTLEDGTDVKVGEEIWCSISEENREAAHSWLRANKLGSVIKCVVAATFGMGDEKKATALYESLLKKKLDASKEERVHPSTLKSLVKEILAGKVTTKTKEGEKAVELPPSISYITAPTTIIKTKEK